MKIISKRRAMKIYHQHPASAFFNTAPADTSGTAVSVITPVRSFLTFPACWRYTPNAARTATGLMSV
ncbi:hypothetical protein HmCmsJML283_03157 [Escherichia coli]|nr:hypothetical protein HmCmsJML283_03157 [Escherichia coli]